MTIIGGLTWRLRLATFEHVPFTPPLLLILVFQPILFHTIVTVGHYMLCSVEKFVKKKKSRAVDYGVANDMSKVTHLLVCIVLTPCFCFASSVSFGSFKNLILSIARDWCRFPSRRLPYTSICLSNFFVRSMFGFIPLFVDFVRYFSNSLITVHQVKTKKIISVKEVWIPGLN